MRRVIPFYFMRSLIYRQTNLAQVGVYQYPTLQQALPISRILMAYPIAEGLP